MDCIVFRSRTTFFGACLLLCSLFTTGNAAADTVEKISKANKAPIDEVWVGTTLAYEAISVGPIIYLAYYNAERKLTVTRIDTKTGEVRKKPLDNIFLGWDSHNNIVLSYDKDGYLHVSGNMHDSPLVYARTMRPNDFDSLVLVNKMVGEDETSTTYPRFMTFPDGGLGYSYRSGQSGNGVELINKFENGHWVRLLSQPLFAPNPGGEPVNAYHTGYIAGPDGYYHIAWVWRKRKGPEFHFNVNYARSKDLKHWEDSQGNKIELPITPSHSEVVDAIPVQSGLLNNIKLGFDLKGSPVISYLKYDKDGNSQLYHAHLEGKKWQIIQTTDWKYRWTFGNGGLLQRKISFSGVAAKEGQLFENVIHVNHGSKTYYYDPGTMKKIWEQSRTLERSVSQTSQSLAPSAKEKAASLFRQMTSRIHPKDRDSFKGYIQWKSLGTENYGRPRTCESIRQKDGCSMTSTLYLVRSMNGRPPREGN